MLPFFEKKEEDLFVYEFKNFSFPAHFHPAMEVLVVEKGAMEAVISAERYTVSEGEIAVTFPGRIHYYEKMENTENEGYLLLIGQRLLGEYKSEAENNLPKKCIFKAEELDCDCVNAAQVLRGAEGKPYRMQKAYARMFLYHIFEVCELVETKEESGLLYELIGYMEKHYAENLSLTGTAEALYVSKYRLSRVLSRFLGVSFNDYLNSMRVQQAMRMIENNDGTFSSIAYDVGFENVRTFNRAFKKLCGMTPTEFKKRER